MKVTKYRALFSVAGGPFEELDALDSYEAAAQACEKETTHWRCRTDWFVKPVEEYDS